MQHFRRLSISLGAAISLCGLAQAAPVVSRLTPPSELFASGADTPVIARFLPDQRFDLQATVRPDPGQTISSFQFAVDGVPVKVAQNRTSLVTQGLIKGLPDNTAVVSVRAYANSKPGVHTLSVKAVQSDGQQATAKGNFEVVPITTAEGKPARNIIILLGDGMGASHRTAARVMQGYAQGKARSLLAMDGMPYTGMVMTASLNSIVTDSAPGMSNYVTGNKSDNNQEGVWPDDTLDAFDNPRMEYLAEYLHRKQGKSLGIVTTADVFDATPAANAVHTANRGNGTGIVDQYLDDRKLTGLAVLMGGGRKWFLPNVSDSTSPQAMNGSQRRSTNDYVLPDDIVAGWGAAKGARDPQRDLIADFQTAGFAYAHDASTLKAALKMRPPKNATTADKLLGLFAYSNMNVALDKIGGRRGVSTVTTDYGFPDQPMLDEMTEAALSVLSRQPRGFVAMIEGASIDKQAHAMDSDRWMLEMLEFDRAVKVALEFARRHKDTLVIVTADHECAGAAIIGASRLSQSELLAKSGSGAVPATTAELRDKVVGTYEAAGFPRYRILPDGYPETTNVDRRMLIGYGANADRYETWQANEKPTQDSQQPFVGQAPLNAYARDATVRNKEAGFLVTGQVPGDQAVHTATDIPLSAFGPGARQFTGVYDNTDVFFKLGRAVFSGRGK